IQGCDSDKKKDESSETVGTEQSAIQPEIMTTDSVSQVAPITQEAAVTQPAISAAPTNVQATAAGMNPAHGQPGHRCDIAVGAPLNSPPGQPPATTSPSTGTQAPAMTPVVTTPTIQAPPQATQVPAGPTPAGMNPPHGQPGHDCAVAVGAPLKK
nr:hypothetical protein [Bacteroidia bacterium]